MAKKYLQTGYRKRGETFKESDFLSRINIVKSGCWEWKGAQVGNGYGRIWIKRTPILAHRWSYEHFNRPLCVGEIIRHQCHNPACVNPKHLLSGTMQQNSKDMVNADRSSAKLTKDNVIAIRKMREKYSVKYLADLYAVDKSTIYRILRKDTWRV